MGNGEKEEEEMTVGEKNTKEKEKTKKNKNGKQSKVMLYENEEDKMCKREVKDDGNEKNVMRSLSILNEKMNQKDQARKKEREEKRRRKKILEGKDGQMTKSIK